MITDCLGETRPITRTYPDGSFDCPFCAAAVRTPARRCSNPWCAACDYAFDGQGAPKPSVAETFAKKAAADRDRAAELERWTATQRWATQYAHEQNTARQDAYAEKRALAVARKACLVCFDATGRGWADYAKIVKHRGECPRSRVAA